MAEKKYWPFKVLPVEQQTDQHKKEIGFLETAYREGFRSYQFWAGDLGAEAPNGRIGEIVIRGQRGWEVILYAGDEDVASTFTHDIEEAGQAVLAWLRGSDAATALQACRS